ncbi:MAG TPA: TetR family transcriptional regulator [Solirubrobacteraceae bacterium]|jgi:AcrR family transcriptional regulator|nr:TetR family transcriptional regulator [Solirubrobacteraceae bacterium]
MDGGQGASSGLSSASGRSAQSEIARERVSGIQRERIVRAMLQEISEGGMENLTVGLIVARAGVSRRTFYEIFQDRQDCLFAAFADGIGRIAQEVIPCYEGPGIWRERIRESLVAALLFLDHEPCLARLLIVDSLGAGAALLQRRWLAVAQVVKAIEEGGRKGKDGGMPSSLIAEGLVGAVLSIVHGRIVERGNDGSPVSTHLIELVNPLMSMIVLPYLGSAAARQELQRPSPTLSPRNGSVVRDPLLALDMRLTYRTVRVLTTLRSRPGSSNRVVAEESGISDQGQISKLLKRLQGFGLVENSAAGGSNGAPNAWMLTPNGMEVQGAFGS